jgi:hypothetical protein
VALSVKFAFSESPRPLAGMLPCGDRTFLPASELEPIRRAAIRLTGPTRYCNRGAYFVLNGFQELREARLGRAAGLDALGFLDAALPNAWAM